MISLWLETTVSNEMLTVGFKCPVSQYMSCDYSEYWAGGALGSSVPDEVMLSAVPKVIIFDEGNTSNLFANLVCMYKVHDEGRIVLNIENGTNCIVKDFDGNMVQDGYSWDVDESSKGVKCFFVKGTNCSSTAIGTVFKAKYISNLGIETVSVPTSVEMYQINTVADKSVEPRTRRELGVRENVNMYIRPDTLKVRVESGIEEDAIVKDIQYTNLWSYTAPPFQTNDVVRFSIGDVEHFIPFEIYEPTGIVGRYKQDIDSGYHNVAGFYEIRFDVFLAPTNVSFSALEYMEVGMVSTNATGYFLHPSRTNWLDHSQCGANVWCSIPTIDRAGCEGECPQPWGEGGAYSWPIPILWRFKSNPESEKYLCTIEQSFSIDSNGTFKVSKFGYIGTCYTNRSCFLNKEN
jgi:hypothetical protein